MSHEKTEACLFPIAGEEIDVRKRIYHQDRKKNGNNVTRKMLFSLMFPLSTAVVKKAYQLTSRRKDFRKVSIDGSNK